MRTLSIAPAQDHLLADNAPFFYLADTCWSAFTNPTIEEWVFYLDVRARQGFNALQINILPQGDRSQNTWDNPLPFARQASGAWDFSQPNNAYFDRCVSMLEMATERGFTPALILMWADLVPGTWVNREYHTKAMRLEDVAPYARLVVEKFARFNPIWIVSGDSDLPEQGAVWYKTARDTLKQCTPHLLCTFHMGSTAPLPEDWTDIYLTYSGHGVAHMDGAYTQATDRWNCKLRHPILNGEPCYEAHGSGPGYRFSAFDIRKAFWWSVLAGAKAGFAYGGHGVWSWHRAGQFFCNMAFALEPLDWRDAIHLPGAVDVCRSKAIFETARLFDVVPRQDLLVDAPEQVRCAASSDLSRIALYVPYAQAVKLNVNLSDYRITTHNLAERSQECTRATFSDASSILRMVRSNADVVIVAQRAT